MAPPKLAPPGAGVPAWQRWAGKYVLLPAWCLWLSWDRVGVALDNQARKLIAGGRGLGEEQLTRRVLVPPQIGLEDSSRYYSYAMVLEHLTIVGADIARIVVDLTHGRQPDGVVRTADLKPKGQQTAAQAMRDYLAMLEVFKHRTTYEIGDHRSPARHAHPWFGPLRASQWICFTPFHQTIHIRQMAAILRTPPGRMGTVSRARASAADLRRGARLARPTPSHDDEQDPTARAEDEQRVGD